MFPYAQSAIVAALNTDIGRQAWTAFNDEGKFLVPPFCRIDKDTGKQTFHRFSMVEKLKHRPEV